MVSSLKPRVANVINDQLPAFLNTSAPNFVKFMEHYYEWLESNSNPLEFIRNLMEQHDYDNADETYRLLLEKGVLNNLPFNLNVDKSILIKNIKEIFKLKGTEDSFQFLLNALFSEQSELKYGRDMYLKTSDSTYSKDVIICVKKPKFSVDLILHKGGVEEVLITENTMKFASLPAAQVTRSSFSEVLLPDVEIVLSGRVISITVINGGYGYTSATVNIIGNNTIQATGTALITDGIITRIVLDNGGSGYSEKPTIEITGNGIGASASLDWEAVVGGVNIINGSSGWSVPPILSLVGGQGTKEVYNSKGEIVEVVKLDPATVEFTVDNSGVVNSAIITHPGTAYFDHPQLRWETLPPVDAVFKVFYNELNGKVTSIHVTERGSLYQTPPTFSITEPDNDYFLLEGNRIEQKGDVYATAIVDDVTSYIINDEEFFVIKLQKEGLKGEFVEGSYIETTINELTISGIVMPIFSDVVINQPGAGYKKGQYLSFLNTSVGGRLFVDEVSRGVVEELIITKSGQNYIPNEKLVLGGNTLGSDFDAQIATVDGIGCQLQAVMELDEVKVVDRGYNYQIGDIIYLYGGNNDLSDIGDAQLAKLEVTGIVASDDYVAAKIVNGGTGYSYTSLAILPNVGSSTPLRQIRPNLDSYKNGVKYASKGMLSRSIVGGVIKSIDWTLEDVDLNNSSVTMLVNGAYGSLSVSGVSGGGSITGLVINNVGVNYVNPRVNFITSVGQDAQVNLLFNEYGSVIADNTISSISWSAQQVTVVTTNPHLFVTGNYVTISGSVPVGYNGVYQVTKLSNTSFRFYKAINPGTSSVNGVVHSWRIVLPGTGFSIGDDLALYEQQGSGAVVVPLLASGGLSSFEYLSRGEFFEIDKYGKNKYTLYGGNGGGLELDLYYRPKHIKIVDQGKYYSDYTLSVTDAHGSGALLEADIKNDVIYSLNITNAGTGYTWCELAVTSSTGHGFESKVTLNAGTIQSIAILDGGQGYDALNNITVYGDGTAGAVSISTIRDGVIKSVKVKDGGTHYHYESFVNIASTLTPTIPAILSKVIENGTLKSVSVVNGGAGYSLNSKLTLSYVEASEDPDSSHVWHGVGKYIGDHYDPINGVDTHTYRGADIPAHDSPIWPLGGAGIVNTLFQVVDFVDIWPQTLNFPKDARFKVSSEPFGTISGVTLVSGGSGYFSSSERAPLILNVAGDGSGASLHPILKDGSIIDVIIEDGGEDYTAATIIVQGGQLAGTPAVLIPYVVDGVIVDVAINNSGTGYYYGTYAEIDGDGSSASVSVQVETGITRFEIIDAGSGYSNASVTVSDNNPPNTTPGSGAIILPIVENGKVVDLHIIERGHGYFNPEVLVSAGTGAPCIINLYADRPISSINLIDSGRNYTNASVRIYGDGNGATATANISMNSLKDIEITYAGNRYTKVPKVVITDTSGFGAISSVNILNPGRGFHDYPILSINSPNGRGGEVVAYSNSIGRAKSIRFDEFSFGSDSRPLLQFPATILVPENANFVPNEYVYVKGFDSTNIDIIPHAKIKHIDFDRNLVYLEDMTENYDIFTENGISIALEGQYTDTLVHEASLPINEGDIIVGASSNSECKILRMNRATGTASLGGTGRYPLKIKSSQSVSNSSIKISNNQRYQDFSYIVRTGLMFNDYKTFIDKLVHTAGFSAWGDVVINTRLEVKNSLPVDEETGRALYNIITLYFTIATGFMPKAYKEVWRIENNSVANYQSTTIEELEAILATGVLNSTTWLTEILRVVEVGSGTYSLTNNIITVTKVDHGLSVNDKVYLLFTSGAAVSAAFLVRSTTSNTFTVETYSSISGNVTTTHNAVAKTGTYVWFGNTCSITIPSHGYLVNDVIHINLQTGIHQAGHYTVVSKTTNTLTVTMPTYSKTTSVSTSGNVVIKTCIDTTIGDSTFTTWKNNTFYTLNDIVEFNVDELFVSKSTHISSSTNAPYSINDNWYRLETLERTSNNYNLL